MNRYVLDDLRNLQQNIIMVQYYITQAYDNCLWCTRLRNEAAVETPIRIMLVIIGKR
jgi:hypothetical protein